MWRYINNVLFVYICDLSLTVPTHQKDWSFWHCGVVWSMWVSVPGWSPWGTTPSHGWRSRTCICGGGWSGQSRRGSKEVCSHYFYRYLEFQKCVDFRMGLVKTEVCDELAMVSKCVKWKQILWQSSYHCFCFFVLIAKRSCKVSVGGPWGEMSVERNLPALKFYHDFSCGKYQYQCAFQNNH